MILRFWGLFPGAGRGFFELSVLDFFWAFVLFLAGFFFAGMLSSPNEGLEKANTLWRK
jgi:hypothetical protein